MSNATLKKFEYPEIDDYTVLEAGLRIPEQRRGNNVTVRGNEVSNPGAFASKRDNLPGEQIGWAKTKTRPQGAKMRRIEVPMTTEGFVPIPEKDEQGNPVLSIFDIDGGLLMLKVVTKQPRGHFVVPVRYFPPQRENGSKARNWDPVYGYDPTNRYPGREIGQRENGDFVYSIPIEGLIPHSDQLSVSEILRGKKHNKLFFLIRFKKVDDESMSPYLYANMEVDKINVSRGPKHFRVILENYWYNSEKNPVRLDKLDQLLDGESNLQDLPIVEAVRLYLDDLHRKR